MHILTSQLAQNKNASPSHIALSRRLQFLPPSFTRTSPSPIKHHRPNHKRHCCHSAARQLSPLATERPEKRCVRAPDHYRNPVQRLVFLADSHEPDGVDADHVECWRRKRRKTGVRILLIFWENVEEIF